MRVIFLDRDGVINRYPGDFEYVKSWEEFRFLPGVKEALKKLNENRFMLFIVSNQAGVGKGLYSQESLNEITANMLNSLQEESIHIAGVFYCTHRQEENCSCRKPKTGLLDLAISQLESQGLDIERQSSYFIGDSIRDVETGKSAKLKTILVFSGREKPQNQETWQNLPDFTALNLSKAVDLILGNSDPENK